MTGRYGLFALLIPGMLGMLGSSPSASGATPREEEANVVVFGVEVVGRITHTEQPARGGVLLIPGSLYSDIDGNYPSMNLRPNVYADLARQIAAQGFIVMRMAKIGPGTGSRTLDASQASRHLDFAARVTVAAAGLDRLRAVLQRGPLVIAGHSEGALVASLLAAGPRAINVDGVVSLSGPALPLLTLLRDQVARMAPPGITPDLRMFDQTVAAIRLDRPLPEGASQDPGSAMLANMPSQAHTYLRSVDKVDPLAAIGQVAQPVLLIQGERDDSVPASHVDALSKARGDRPTRLVRLPGLTHFYKSAPAGLLPAQSMALETPTDPAVAAAIASWIGEQMPGKAAVTPE